MIDRRSLTKALAAMPFTGLKTAMITPKRPIVDHAAPDFALTLIDKTKVSLSELRGRATATAIWTIRAWS